MRRGTLNLILRKSPLVRTFLQCIHHPLRSLVIFSRHPLLLQRVQGDAVWAPVPCVSDVWQRGAAWGLWLVLSGSALWGGQIYCLLVPDQQRHLLCKSYVGIHDKNPYLIIASSICIKNLHVYFQMKTRPTRSMFLI